MGACSSKRVPGGEGEFNVPVRVSLHDGPIGALCSTSNGLTCSAGEDRVISLYNWRTDNVVGACRGHGKSINCLVSLPAPTAAAAGTADTISAAAAPAGNPAAQAAAEQEVSVAEEVLPNDWLFSSSRDLTVRLWNVQTQKCLRVFEGHELTVSAIDVHPNGAVLASGSRDTSVRLWDVETGATTATCSTSRNLVTCMRFLPGDPNVIAQGSEDLSVRLWDTRMNPLRASATLRGYVYFPLCMDASMSGTYLATGCKGFNGVGCDLKIWDLRTSSILTELSGHQQDVTECMFLRESDDQHVLSTSKDATLRVWNIPAGQQHAVYRDCDSAMLTGMTRIAEEQDTETGGRESETGGGATLQTPTTKRRPSSSSTPPTSSKTATNERPSPPPVKPRGTCVALSNFRGSVQVVRVAEQCDDVSLLASSFVPAGEVWS